MADEERPIAYTALPLGIPVLSAAGARLGVVDRVVADYEQDIFRGIVVRGRQGWRFVERRHVDRLTTARVVLTLEEAAFDRLPEPTPAQLERDRETVYAPAHLSAGRDRFVVVVRCARGGLFETLWVPGASFRSLRLGPWRIMRCPVHDRVEVVHIVDPASLTPQERAAAATHPAGPIP